MHWVAETLAYLFPYVLPNTDNVAGRPHLHDLAVVRHSFEGSVHQQSAFAEHRLDVERHLHIGGIHVLVLQDYRIEFQYAIVFGIHSCKYTKKIRNPSLCQSCGFFFSKLHHRPNRLVK